MIGYPLCKRCTLVHVSGDIVCQNCHRADLLCVFCCNADVVAACGCYKHVRKIKQTP